MKYFKKVEFGFCIHGHNNNTCDRMFNQMKLKYHKMDFFTWTHALETLNTSNIMNDVDVKESVFKDYGRILEFFYGSYNNHIFRVNGSNG
jgi:hypothetical protein